MTNPHHPQFDCDLHARHEQNETERLRRKVRELEQQRDELVESLQAKVDILTESAENWRDNLADRTNELTAATKRIAELEAAMPLYDELLTRTAIAESQLAALRKRIEDAPVVAWKHTMRLGIMFTDGATHNISGVVSHPLIRKEDLK